MKFLDKKFAAVFVAGFLALVTAVGWGVYTSFHTNTHFNCHVTGKDRASTGKSSEMRVYTSCGTFKIADSFVMGRFDSADMYGRLEVNKTYDFKTRGVRVPFFSMFSNIESSVESSD